MPTNLEPIPMADAVDSARQTAFLDGAGRGASIMVAVLAYLAATRGTAFAERVVLLATDMASAYEVSAIVVKHASAAPTIDSLHACAAELVAWAERGN